MSMVEKLENVTWIETAYDRSSEKLIILLFSISFKKYIYTYRFF